MTDLHDDRDEDEEVTLFGLAVDGKTSRGTATANQRAAPAGAMPTPPCAQ